MSSELCVLVQRIISEGSVQNFGCLSVGSVLRDQFRTLCALSEGYLCRMLRYFTMGTTFTPFFLSANFLEQNESEFDLTPTKIFVSLSLYLYVSPSSPHLDCNHHLVNVCAANRANSFMFVFNRPFLQPHLPSWIS